MGVSWWPTATTTIIYIFCCGVRLSCAWGVVSVLYEENLSGLLRLHTLLPVMNHSAGLSDTLQVTWKRMESFLGWKQSKCLLQYIENRGNRKGNYLGAKHKRTEKKQQNSNSCYFDEETCLFCSCEKELILRLHPQVGKLTLSISSPKQSKHKQSLRCVLGRLVTVDITNPFNSGKMNENLHL